MHLCAPVDPIYCQTHFATEEGSREREGKMERGEGGSIQEREEGEAVE